MRKLVAAFCFEALIFLVIGPPGLTKELFKNSPLCSSATYHITMVGFSTSQFDVAICKATDGEDGYQYVGQDRKTKAKIALPVTWMNNPHAGDNPWVVKAKKGEYTYQIAQFNPLGDHQSASLSVFKNGARIYHQTVHTLLIGEHGNI